MKNNLITTVFLVPFFALFFVADTLAGECGGGSCGALKPGGGGGGGGGGVHIGYNNDFGVLFNTGDDIDGDGSLSAYALSARRYAVNQSRLSYLNEALR